MTRREQCECVYRFSARRTVDRRACRVEVNNELDLEVRLENLVMTGACLSSNEERVVLYENRRESRDSARLVMREAVASPGFRGWRWGKADQ